MIIPEKPNTPVSRPDVGVVRSSSQPKSSDAQSVMTQEPPPYSEAGTSVLSSSPPPLPRTPRPRPPPKGHSEPSHRETPELLDVRRPGPSLHAPPSPKPYSSQVQLAPMQPSPHHRPKSMPPSSPRPMSQHPYHSPSMDSEPSPRMESQACNFLAERKKNSSLKGVWNLDTGLPVPESLHPPISEFYGFWNEMDKKSQRAREKARKKHSGGGWGRRKSSEPYQPPKLNNEGIKPNLMLASNDGGVQAEVNVSASDGVPRMATIVAESNDGSVKLTVNSSPDQSLRIFAISMDGSVRVRIPPTFEGAIWMTTEDGSTHISDGIKPRLTTFSVSNKTARCYLGDWQSTHFGHTGKPSSPHSPESEDPFKSWTGPLVHIYSRDGSVHLSYTGEDTSSTFSKAMRSIYNGIVGSGNDAEGEKVADPFLQRSPMEQEAYLPRMVWSTGSIGSSRPHPH
ncbi:hypothetical protein V565_106720 [Rhizoctonia solani 123E]|uniref:DUF7330 domain-containing protein n=1 Tax=Rhizoctonia solani 123E TaxID=1423351 RepID=A0A074SGJ8_9AGAM|nr:hypothetical protein V565_106720 [Rhizoctonia solani 123E]